MHSGQWFPAETFSQKLTATATKVIVSKPKVLIIGIRCVTPTGLIVASPFDETNVRGLFAAGDNSSMMRSLVTASANGTTAGAWINRELVGEDVAVR